MSKKLQSVLLIEDEPFDVIWVKEITNELGCFKLMTSSENGEEALKLFTDYFDEEAENPSGFPPNLIFLDLSMPKMDGLEFLAALTQLAKEKLKKIPPIVIYTSSDDPEETKSSLQYKCVKEYILKPITGAKALELSEKFGS